MTINGLLLSAVLSRRTKRSSSSTPKVCVSSCPSREPSTFQAQRSRVQCWDASRPYNQRNSASTRACSISTTRLRERVLQPTHRSEEHTSELQSHLNL